MLSFRASSSKSGATHCYRSTSSAPPSELLTSGSRLAPQCVFVNSKIFILKFSKHLHTLRQNCAKDSRHEKLNFETVRIFLIFYLKKQICQEFAYFMFVMVMSMLLPALIMLASYIAIVFVIFRLSSFLFPNLAFIPCTHSRDESLKDTGRKGQNKRG